LTDHVRTSAASTGRPLEIRVTGGTVRGVRQTDRTSWLGVPYARAPVGALRFRAPQPVEPWEGVRDATEFGRVATQAFHGQFRGVGPGVPSGEDCLNLNVTVPAEPKGPAGRMPVMVWIHGGGYSSGSSRDFAGQGDSFISSGRVMFVSINYRLSALGYLDFTRYATAERPIDSNLGLRDQIAALRWVHDNIAAFGGDPENVTVFGESAGGNAIAGLLGAPSSARLFARAIAQSPPPAAFYSPAMAAMWAGEFVDILRQQQGSSAPPLELLTTTPATDLATASTTLQIRTPAAYPGTFCLAPVVDGDVLPEPPLTALREGRGLRVPLVVGTNEREGAIFRGRIDILPSSPARMRTVFDHAPPNTRRPMRAAYPGLPARRPSADFAGDFGFWFPSTRMADHQSKVAPVHAYRFDVAPRLLKVAGLDATHGVEVPVLFDEGESPLVRAMSLLGGRGPYADAGDRLRAYWLEFATTGTMPDSWPPYTTHERHTLIVDDIDRVESDPRGAKRRVWERFMPEL
jgi:para-nitrobenzyl esterase